VTNAGSDPVAAELQRMRESIEALGARVGQLAEENAALRHKLELSEAARSDLTAQAEHLIHELGLARQEVQKLQRDD
jgi:chromosome segregation ATPase